MFKAGQIVVSGTDDCPVISELGDMKDSKTFYVLNPVIFYNGQWMKRPFGSQTSSIERVKHIRRLATQDEIDVFLQYYEKANA